MNTYKYSASKLTVSESCPLHFYLQYIKKIYPKVDTHPSAAAGSVFHRAVYEWYLSGMGNRQSLIDLADKAFDLCVSDKEFTLSDLYIAANRMDMIAGVKILLGNFYDDMDVAGALGKPLGFEREFEFPWETTKGIILLHGYIDRILIGTEGLRITDYKTSSILPSQSKVDKDIQLTIYSAAYRRMASAKVVGDWPKAERYAELYFPKFRVMRRSARTKAHFDDLKERLLKALDREITEDKTPNPNKDSCRFCPFSRNGDCRSSYYFRKGN